MKLHLSAAVTILVCARLTCSSVAWSQAGYAPATDVLGAHLNSGRGCTACHAPHGGAMGNGNAKTADPSSGVVALWGEDVGGLYGKTIATGGGKYVEVLPTSMTAETPDVAGLLTCSMGNYVSEHPVGLTATLSCGGSGWDCTENHGSIEMKGANSSRFVSNYGYFVKPAIYNGNAVVMCTTCHDQHVMNVVTVGANSTSGLPAGNYATMFFLRAPYNPNDSNPMSNQTAQFCRQCHGEVSNEMNGGTARTVF